MSNDSAERAMYEKREKANKDRTSALEKALSDGIEQGVISVAKKLKASGLPTELIEQATGLTQAQIELL